MTWDPEFDLDDDFWEDDSAEMRAADIRVDRPPAVWPVFVAFIGALVVFVGVQLILSIGIVVWLLVNGANAGEIDRDLRDAIAWPGVLTAIASVTQAIVAAAGLIAAWFSGEGFVKSLGFGKPRLPLYGWPLVVLGAAPPAFLGVALHLGMSQLLPPDQTIDKAIGRLTWASAAPFILFISLTPGFVEEGFFRGYMQRRLLKRWPPFYAILVSSAAFAFLHLDLHTIVFAFPLGCWLGVIAWRTGSIWPCIVTHAAWNAGSVSWSVGEHLLGWPEYPPLIPSIFLGVLVLGCFIASIWLLARTTPPTPDDDVPVAALAPD